MRVTLPFLSLLVLTACPADPKPEDTGSPSEVVDADGDGYADDVDCDDGDPAVFPGAEELCNEVDDDCDGEIDEEGGASWYPDADGDGYAGEDGAVVACDAPNGFLDVAEDCDDGDADIHPEADEHCNGVDDDCDGEIDEDPLDLWYADGDGDGYGDAASSITSCDPGSGWVPDDSDCDDEDADIHPEAEERCNGIDDDCDEEIDEGLDVTWYADADGDGFGDASVTTEACEAEVGWVDNDLDCDDANTAITPLANEACDGFDNDCDGLIDDADMGVLDPSTWYYDGDGDGYGLDHKTLTLCAQPSGYAALGGDCDDLDVAFNPGAAETDCTDPNDYNCDGSTGYADDDGDGFAACAECDDLDAAIFPGADERCDGVDNDCDGDVDEDDAIDATTWYADADADGFGDASSTDIACDQPSGFVADASDCDDSDGAVHPAATEVCDGVDNDCDGATDEDDAADASTWYADGDGDGYGDASSSDVACDQPSGFVADATDCDDGSAAAYPGATEVCDGLDNDCDGATDEDAAADAATWYADDDGDGYGDASDSSVACYQPSGAVADATDCDDGDSAVNPAATEYCNGVDDDCDGSTDEDSAADAGTWYADADGDGYGDASDASAACSQPSGTVADATDCDDGDGAVNPAATELCNGVDDDCDGDTDEDSAADVGTWYADADGDGYGNPSATTLACDAPSSYVGDASDCDDSDSAVNPAATELCNGVDDDCDGSTDEDSAADAGAWYADADADGYGDASATTAACSAPSGYVADATDCDDSDGSVHPGATERCSGVDDDCDGTVDEPADLLGSDPACGAVNCNEILSTRSSAPDGEYWLEFDGSSLQVFCDMTTAGGGWNVIHPDDMGNLGSLDAMRDELDTAMAYLRHSSGALYYTELFQLTAYAAYDVDVSDYDSTRTRVTFIPIGVAAVAGATQGFTSNGSELTFTNCDANPNSYIEFWHTGDSYAWSQDYTMSLMWRDSKLPASVAVPSDYFTFTAIHQGGCGTHSTSPYWHHYDGMQDAALAVR